MSNIIIKLMQGLPGSGKSTIAKAAVASGGGRVVRVNKDELRDMMFPGRSWSKAQENITVAAQKSIVRCLVNAHDIDMVIVDDTNFNPSLIKMWQEVAHDDDCQLVIEKVETPVDVCIANDLKRKGEGGHYVGPDVIKNMAAKYGLLKQEREWIGFDLDGTLADITIRREASVRDDGKLDYGKFFDPALVETDAPRHDIIKAAKDAKDLGYDVVILSGRSDRTREATVAWLAKYEVVYDRLIMRPSHNHQDDTILKRNFLNHYLDKSKCVKIFDDRPKVIRMWVAEGIPVEDVGNGVEF